MAIDRKRRGDGTEKTKIIRLFLFPSPSRPPDPPLALPTPLSPPPPPSLLFLILPNPPPQKKKQLKWTTLESGYRDGVPYELKEASFETPALRSAVARALPEASRVARARLLTPAPDPRVGGGGGGGGGGSFSSRPPPSRSPALYVHLAGTGDHGFDRRLRLGAPLLAPPPGGSEGRGSRALSAGIATLALESPFYGGRRPPWQVGARSGFFLFFLFFSLKLFFCEGRGESERASERERARSSGGGKKLKRRSLSDPPLSPPAPPGSRASRTSSRSAGPRSRRRSRCCGGAPRAGTAAPGRTSPPPPPPPPPPLPPLPLRAAAAAAAAAAAEGAEEEEEEEWGVGGSA